ncbi:MAG: sensor histidine kinase, partial [Spirochaetota bacterium]
MDNIMTDEYYIVEQIIRNISHEIKNPLTIMKGYTQLLSTGVNDAAAVQKSQKMVLEQIDRINQTFDHLYSTFSIVTTETEKIDIVGVVRDFMDNLPGEISGRVNFYTDPEYCMIKCDK